VPQQTFGDVAKSSLKIIWVKIIQ